jgi:hypothetical protein
MNGPTESTLLERADCTLLEQENAALRFDAPFLIEKLLKERIADTWDEGEALFMEVKRFLVLSRVVPSVAWNMYSARVDEVWHQFVLFTTEYLEFCRRYFGRYIHHLPSNAPGSSKTEALEPSTFGVFQSRYEALFGVPLPDLWWDDRSVTLSRRVIFEDAGRSLVCAEGGMITLARLDGTPLFSVSEIAREALDFMCRTGTFYVRELPGLLTDEEKTGLVATLVEHRVLRVAP